MEFLRLVTVAVIVIEIFVAGMEVELMFSLEPDKRNRFNWKIFLAACHLLFARLLHFLENCAFLDILLLRHSQVKNDLHLSKFVVIVERLTSDIW